ncbi:MAG: hypothetical protein CXT78_06750 [Thaumarchaeota archaeon]|jgi:hypothetical protein|nr:MAG: hypothetical protein CXT78_06750 [Nitrososphaerota archaeon]
MNEMKNNQKSILFIDSSISLDKIINITKTIPNIKIFTFDYVSHKLLSKHKILHEISDNFLSENDLDLIQEQSYVFTEWYKIQKIRDYQNFEGVDLGSLFKIEFYIFLLPFLKKIFEIKNIISSNQNLFIYTTNQLYDICMCFEKNVNLINKKQIIQNDFVYDKLKFENNFFHLEISHKTYKILFNILSKFLGLFFKPKKNNPDVLLVEFNTILYKEFFSSFPKCSLTSVFYGLRRLPIWNLKSFFIFRNSKCKISSSVIQNSKFKFDIQEKSDRINKIFLELIQNYDKDFEQFFKLNNFSFWNILKPSFVKLFKKHNFESIENIIISKKTLENVQPKHVILLSESGKTEQIMLQLCEQLCINSVLLQHALGHDNLKGHDFNHYSGTVLVNSDHFIIWGDAMHRYAKKYNLPLEKIIKIGSVVHDQTFQIDNDHNPDSILVAAQGPLNMHIRDYTVKANIEYENIIRTISKVAKNNNKKLIIKLHPYESDNGEPIITKEIDSNIRVIKKGDILPLISSCNFMISLGTSMSNVILDGHILKKPVIRIPFGEWMGSPDQLRESSCYNIQLNEFDSILQRLFSDTKFRDQLINQGQKFVKDCLDNQGKASENIAKFLKEN